MTKNVKGFFVVLMMFSFVSFSFVGKDTPTEGLTIGDRAPDFKICSDKELVNLKDFRGKYVLLSFWASYDADSRMSNISMNQVISQTANIEMVSVSFDDYKSVFNETIKKDQILIPNCFVEVKGVHSDIYKTYRLYKGFKNYLIDKNGVIIAKNIQANELSKYIN